MAECDASWRHTLQAYRKLSCRGMGCCARGKFLKRAMLERENLHGVVQADVIFAFIELV